MFYNNMQYFDINIIRKRLDNPSLHDLKFLITS
jgi:hypothetical protein